MSNPPAAQDGRRPISFVAAAGWAIGATLFLDVAVAFTEFARPGALQDLVSLTGCHVLTYSLVAFVMLRMYEPDTGVLRVFAIRRAPVLAFPLAAIVGAGIYPALTVVDGIAAKRFPPTPEETELIGNLMTATTTGKRVALVMALVFLMPAAEELFFRGLLFGGLRRSREGMAILGTAIYFAAARGGIRAFGSMIVLGLVLAWLRSRAGSTLVSLTAHVAFFAVPVIPMVMGRDPMADEIYPRSWVIGGLVIATAAGLLAELMSRSNKTMIACRIEDAGSPVVDA